MITNDTHLATPDINNNILSDNNTLSDKIKKIHQNNTHLPITVKGIEDKLSEIANMVGCAKNTMLPQLNLPDDVICTLDRIQHDAYIIHPLNGSIPKIPEGKVSFVILADDPLRVFCFEHNEVYNRKELRDQASGPINFGHSSLAFKEGGIILALNRERPLEERKALSTKSVLLAGTMTFHEHDNPCFGGGELHSWSNDSGHFKPTNEHALQNRLGFVKVLLPMDKYVGFHESLN